MEHRGTFRGKSCGSMEALGMSWEPFRGMSCGCAAVGAQEGGISQRRDFVDCDSIARLQVKYRVRDTGQAFTVVSRVSQQKETTVIDALDDTVHHFLQAAHFGRAIVRKRTHGIAMWVKLVEDAKSVFVAASQLASA